MYTRTIGGMHTVYYLCTHVFVFVSLPMRPDAQMHEVQCETPPEILCVFC